MHHKEIHVSDWKSRSKGKSHWEKTRCLKKKAVSKTAQDRGQKHKKLWYNLIFITSSSKKSLFPYDSIISFGHWQKSTVNTCDLFWLFSRRLYSSECVTYLVWINFQGRNLSNFWSWVLERSLEREKKFLPISKFCLILLYFWF